MAAKKSSIWTPANIVTCVRVVFVPVWLLMAETLGYMSAKGGVSGGMLATFVAFCLLSLTDKLDGYLARSRNEVTTFGKFLDPIADKLVVIVALCYLLERGEPVTWALLVIISREFLVSGLRMVVASKGVVIAAGNLGKWKTATTMGAICVNLLALSFPAGSVAYDDLCLLAYVLLAVAVVLTIWSGLDYFRGAWGSLADEEPEGEVDGTVSELVAEGSGYACGAEAASDAAEQKSGSSFVMASADADFREDGAAEGGEPCACAASAGTEQGEGVSAAASSAEEVFGEGGADVADDYPTWDDAVAYAAEVLEVARVKGVTLGSAESCTGGLVEASLTAVPGSSDVVMGAVGSYACSVKSAILGVSELTLAEHGAVSSECASEMAEGARTALGCDVSVSVTGIAGPGGAVPGKPVGTVWFGVSDGQTTKTVRECFGGGRAQVRLQSVMKALELLKGAC